MIERKVLLRISVVVLLAGQGICDNEYAVKYKQGMEGCKDFENDFFKGDGMDVSKTSSDGETSTYLEGCLEVLKPIEKGILIGIEIAKETEIGSEPMWSFSMDLCQSMEDTDAPWAGALKSMNITGCPVDPGSYCCDKFDMDTSFMSEYMKKETEGSYDLRVKLSNSQNTDLSCHQMGLCIHEV